MNTSPKALSSGRATCPALARMSSRKLEYPLNRFAPPVSKVFFNTSGFVRAKLVGAVTSINCSVKKAALLRLAGSSSPLSTRERIQSAPIRYDRMSALKARFFLPLLVTEPAVALLRRGLLPVLRRDEQAAPRLGVALHEIRLR